MLFELVEVDGRIEMHTAKKGECTDVPQHLIDQLIEEATLREIYFEGDTSQLNGAYEEYHGTESVILEEVALMFKQFVDSIGSAGYKITRM